MASTSLPGCDVKIFVESSSGNNPLFQNVLIGAAVSNSCFPGASTISVLPTILDDSTLSEIESEATKNIVFILRQRCLDYAGVYAYIHDLACPSSIY